MVTDRNTARNDVRPTAGISSKEAFSNSSRTDPFRFAERPRSGGLHIGRSATSVPTWAKCLILSILGSTSMIMGWSSFSYGVVGSTIPPYLFLVSAANSPIGAVTLMSVLPMISSVTSIVSAFLFSRMKEILATDYRSVAALGSTILLTSVMFCILITDNCSMHTNVFPGTGALMNLVAGIGLLAIAISQARK